MSADEGDRDRREWRDNDDSRVVESSTAERTGESATGDSRGEREWRTSSDEPRSSTAPTDGGGGSNGEYHGNGGDGAQRDGPPSQRSVERRPGDWVRYAVKPSFCVHSNPPPSHFFNSLTDSTFHFFPCVRLTSCRIALVAETTTLQNAPSVISATLQDLATPTMTNADLPMTAGGAKSVVLAIGTVPAVGLVLTLREGQSV